MFTLRGLCLIYLHMHISSLFIRLNYINELHMESHDQIGTMLLKTKKLCTKQNPKLPDKTARSSHWVARSSGLMLCTLLSSVLGACSSSSLARSSTAILNLLECFDI